MSGAQDNSQRDVAVSGGLSPSDVERIRDNARRLADELVGMEYEMEELRAKLAQAKIEMSALRDREGALKAEVSRLSSDNEQLHERYLAENRKTQRLELQLEQNAHVESARSELAREKRKYREALAALRDEVERLRTIHPIKALLAAKHTEVQIAERAFASLPQNHPERSRMEQFVLMHVAEREQLQDVAEETERLYLERRRQIETEMDQAEASEKADYATRPKPAAPRPPVFRHGKQTD